MIAMRKFILIRNQKRKIVETAEISIDERISILSEIFAIVNKKNTDVT